MLYSFEISLTFYETVKTNYRIIISYNLLHTYIPADWIICKSAGIMKIMNVL